jgi:hypothetical protein
MPWLTSYPLLLGFFILGTAGNALMVVNKSPVLAGEVDSDQRASVFSFMMINFFIWNTLGIQLAGFLANWLPAGSLSKYEWALAVAGINGIASGLTRAFLPFRQQAPAPHRAVDKPPTGGPERLLPGRRPAGAGPDFHGLCRACVRLSARVLRAHCPGHNAGVAVQCLRHGCDARGRARHRHAGAALLTLFAFRKYAMTRSRPIGA